MSGQEVESEEEEKEEGGEDVDKQERKGTEEVVEVYIEMNTVHV